MTTTSAVAKSRASMTRVRPWIHPYRLPSPEGQAEYAGATFGK